MSKETAFKNLIKEIRLAAACGDELIEGDGVRIVIHVTEDRYAVNYGFEGETMTRLFEFDSDRQESICFGCDYEVRPLTDNPCNECGLTPDGRNFSFTE